MTSSFPLKPRKLLSCRPGHITQRSSISTANIKSEKNLGVYENRNAPSKMISPHCVLQSKIVSKNKVCLFAGSHDIANCIKNLGQKVEKIQNIAYK